MSERSHAIPTPEGEYLESSRFAGVSMILGVIAAVALVLCAVAAFLAPEQFAYSWLFGFAYVFTLCAGSYFWIIVHHAVDAEWSVVVRRHWENLAALLPLVALFLVPVILLRHHLYEWMTIPRGEDHSLDAKRLYLNLPFFLIRAVLFFAYFSIGSWLFRRISISQDRDGNPASTLRMRKLAFICLPLFGFSLTFGAFDWLMSLDYHWFSTMWGVYIFAGAAGSSMSLTVLVITWLRKYGYLAEAVTIEHYHIMGKWMLAFTVFWAYIGFSQYMLIWYANIPEETEYYILRNTEGWNLLSLLLVVGRFFLAFAVLLMRSTKTHIRRLCMVAGWVVFMQLLDMYVVVLPELHRNGVHVSIVDFLPVIGMVATLAFFYLRIAAKSSLFPVRDPRLMESLRIVN
ncbi:MAG: hypothetical protein M3Y80_08235 [Verrucomicrobiota bacterium]|nr:hypothetical protein [Verrucomicrobiota bacterium]